MSHYTTHLLCPDCEQFTLALPQTQIFSDQPIWQCTACDSCFTEHEIGEIIADDTFTLTEQGHRALELEAA